MTQPEVVADDEPGQDRDAQAVADTVGGHRDVGDLQDNPAGYLGGGERAVDDRAVAVADREVDEGFAGQVSEGDCFPGCEAMAGRDDKI